MNQDFEHNNPPAPSQVEPDVITLIKKMQQQLVFLEKKIDVLIGQSPGKPFHDRRFSKPFRRFGHSNWHGKKERDNNSGERNFSQGNHFDKRQGGENRGFVQEKKPFFRGRRDRSQMAK